MKTCEGAPWCLLPVVEGSHACRLHTELPAKTMFNTEGGLCTVESAEDWKTRYRRFKKAERDAAVKQAESDSTMAKRK